MADESTPNRGARPQDAQTLIRAARFAFREQGFAAVQPEAVAEQSGLPAAAYHSHFEGKRALFRAAVEDAQRELEAKVSRAAGSSRNLWGELEDGCRAFLEASVEPEFNRLVLVEGPAVLGWEDWRALESAYGTRQLEIILAKLIDSGQLKAHKVEALAHLLAGALNEAALWIARSPHPPEALDEAWDTFVRMLRSLRTG